MTTLKERILRIEKILEGLPEQTGIKSLNNYVYLGLTEDVDTSEELIYDKVYRTEGWTKPGE